MRKFLILFCVLFSLSLSAQDFNARVQVVHTQVQTPNTQIFRNLEMSIQEFINNKKWAKVEIASDERIDLAIIINVSKYELPDLFQANLQIRSTRPVYGSGYNTIIFNHEDNDFTFKYVNFQQMNFNVNSYSDNLTSVLGYYINIVLGLQFDSYSELGGDAYFEVANTTMVNAQGSGASGWSSTDGRNNLNRYWLIENITNERFKPMRKAFHAYHRKGLDIMYKEVDQGRSAITDAIKELQKVAKSVPNSMFMKVFFNAKADEIVNIYGKALETDKNKIIEILKDIDPGNTQRWDKIKGR